MTGHRHDGGTALAQTASLPWRFLSSFSEHSEMFVGDTAAQEILHTLFVAFMVAAWVICLLCGRKCGTLR
jgi:hypothetical protein